MQKEHSKNPHSIPKTNAIDAFGLEFIQRSQRKNKSSTYWCNRNGATVYIFQKLMDYNSAVMPNEW